MGWRLLNDALQAFTVLKKLFIKIDLYPHLYPLFQTLGGSSCNSSFTYYSLKKGFFVAFWCLLLLAVAYCYFGTIVRA